MPSRALLLGILVAASALSQAVTMSVPELKARAEGGEAAAQFELGVRYHEGQGVPKDYAEAMRWFHKAADQGNPDAEFNLGVMYEKGRSVRPDYEQAIRWYRQAADQDYAPAEYNLGVMFDKARGVPQDYVEAMKWYRKAADQGYADAQYNLSLLYFYGQGTLQDTLTADMWIRLTTAANTGYGQTKFWQMRESIESKMTPDQIAEADRLTRAWTPTPVK